MSRIAWTTSQKRQRADTEISSGSPERQESGTDEEPMMAGEAVPRHESGILLT
jgi:hypothetical protein